MTTKKVWWRFVNINISRKD